MKRRGQPQSGAAGVSLFPFLAVLLCTMGALIVVLVVIARQARLQLAEGDAVGAPSPVREELESQQADLQWRIEVLGESRSRTREQLEGQRAELSHLEDHARRLQNQLEELDGARRQFDQLAAGGELEGDRLKREIERIEKKISDKQKELDKAIKKAGSGGDSYAVVAYHGPNETRRRPIYIECRREGVIFQPEGLVLTERDFEGNLGPSSPMSCALRAAREYLARNQLPGEEGTPYPLLLVRPDGIAAYEAAHVTLVESGSEFGYELVGQDWPLEFPPTDPRLTLAMRRAIGEGRLRQAYLARAAPQLRESGPHATFRASPRGGLMRDDGQPIGGGSHSGTHGRRGGRPSWANGGQGDRYAGTGVGTGGGTVGDRAKPPQNRGGNPYRAALASQTQAAGGAAASSAGGEGAGGLAGGNAGATGSACETPVPGGTGARGEGVLGIGAGDFAAGQLNAALDSPTGMLVRAANAKRGASGGAQGPGDTMSGLGGGSSTIPSGNLASAAGAGNQLGKTRGANGNGAGSLGRNGNSGGIGGAGGKSGGTGRGWEAGQDKVAAVAAGLGGSEGLGGEGLRSGAKGGAENGNGPGAAGASGRGPIGKNAGGGPRDTTTAQKDRNGGGPDLGPASHLIGASDALGGKDGPPTGAGGSGATGDAASGNAASGNAASGNAATGTAGAATAKQLASSGSAKSGSSANGSRAGTASNGSGSRGQGGAAGSTTAGGGGGGGGSGGQPQQPMMGMPGIPNMTLGQQQAQQQSIASKRGEKNWANPAANRSSFPVTRPIKIVCDADHLTLLPEGRSRRGFKVIELGEHSEDGVRELVTSVWDRIDTWGVAGQGMYWRPELIMEVEPGGERRFNELKSLMADSGLDVRGRPRQGPVIKYPRTKTPN
ncbi:MAG TPA: hypothetical protein VN699_21800 [Pirellulales bacterium]|nr:hypothetical protein [Pirellulales bacterium]